MPGVYIPNCFAVLPVIVTHQRSSQTDTNSSVGLQYRSCMTPARKLPSLRGLLCPYSHPFLLWANVKQRMCLRDLTCSVPHCPSLCPSSRWVGADSTARHGQDSMRSSRQLSHRSTGGSSRRAHYFQWRGQHRE